MGTEAERQDTRKAMAYDLLTALDENTEKQTYTTDEVKKLIRMFVDVANQK